MNRFEQAANTIANHLWGLWPSHPTLDQIQNTKIVAHRGVHENHFAIENTKKAFDLALENQIWGIELDVHFTKDAVAVVHHDPCLGRLWGPSHFVIKDHSFSELRAVAPEIMSLEEVIKIFGKKIRLLIELKVRPEQNFLNTLSALNPIEDYFLLTLDPHLFQGLPNWPHSATMAVDWMKMSQTLQLTQKYGFGGISGHFLSLNSNRLQICKQKKLITGTGFIETQGALAHEISRGVDWIFTNHPLRLKKYLEELTFQAKRTNS